MNKELLLNIPEVPLRYSDAYEGNSKFSVWIEYQIKDHGQACFEAGQAMSKQPAQQDDWFKTSAELTAVSYEMDVIHERYSGKEKRAEREELLTPLRLKCREIGERRQLLVTPHKKSPTPDPVHAEIIRLTACLKISNDNAEKFEREWYLRGDEIEAVLAQKTLAQQGGSEPALVEKMTVVENQKNPDHPAFHHVYSKDPLDALHDAFLALPVCPLLAVVSNAIQEIQSLRQPKPPGETADETIACGIEAYKVRSKEIYGTGGNKLKFTPERRMLNAYFAMRMIEYVEQINVQKSPKKTASPGLSVPQITEKKQ